MIHPSYVELMKVLNDDVVIGEEPVVNSRYSIVCAAAKRARQIIDGSDPLVRDQSFGQKPLSVAVKELSDGELKILTKEEADNEKARLDELNEQNKALKERLDEIKKEKGILEEEQKPEKKGRGRKKDKPLPVEKKAESLKDLARESTVEVTPSDGGFMENPGGSILDAVMSDMLGVEDSIDTLDDDFEE